MNTVAIFGAFPLALRGTLIESLNGMREGSSVTYCYATGTGAHYVIVYSCWTFDFDIGGQSRS
jgi:hypothetical protein